MSRRSSSGDGFDLDRARAEVAAIERGRQRERREERRTGAGVSCSRCGIELSSYRVRRAIANGVVPMCLRCEEEGKRIALERWHREHQAPTIADVARRVG